MNDKSTSIFQYILYMILLFVILYVTKELFYTENKTVTNSNITSTIEYSDDITSIYVEYPRFNNDKINEIITNILYSYVREFKNNDKNKVLDMTYNIYKFDKYMNVTFHIENTLTNIKNKNILIDLSKNDIAYITNIYNEETLKSNIYEMVNNKYSDEIFELIKESNINNFTYLIDDVKMDIYFNNVKFNDIDYIPYVTIYHEDYSETISNNDTVIENKKLISFTYDDGPSEYTSELLKTLEVNNSSATFFMIGNKIKENESTVLEIYNSNSEIGSHGYSHKDLTTISKKEINNELNSFNIIFREITNDKVKYLRPAYGRYNKEVLSLNNKIVLWNIDPKDWLERDSEIIYNNVIKDACDGCIVLMHDIYPETIEATKKLIPALNDMGYDVVSISKLIELKNYSFNNEPLSYIK